MRLIAITSRSDTVSSPPDLFVRTPESILHMPIGSSLHVLGQLAMFPRPQHVASDSSSVTGIPDDAVVAGVLCRIDKWNRNFLAAVARAVAANPRVHLWMPEMLTTASSRARVMDIFAREGLPLVRVHWVPTLDRNKHLLYKRRIDLVFDTFPYSGHMTTGDALCVHHCFNSFCAPAVTHLHQLRGGCNVGAPWCFDGESHIIQSCVVMRRYLCMCCCSCVSITIHR